MTPEEAQNQIIERDRDDMVAKAMERMRQAQSISPDTMSQAEATSRETGIPAMTLAQNPESMAAREQNKALKGRLQNAPRLANWLQTPDHAALSQDETDLLAQYEQMGVDPNNPEGTAAGRAVERGILRSRSTIPALRASTIGQAITYSAMDEQTLLQSTLRDVANLSEEDMAEIGPIQSTDDAYEVMNRLRQEGKLPPQIGPEEYLAQLETRQMMVEVYRENPLGLIDDGVEAINEFSRLQEAAAALPMSASSEEFMGKLEEDTTLLGTGLTFLQNPVQGATFIAEVGAESSPQIATGLLLGIATRSPVVGAAVLGGGAVVQETGSSAWEFLAEEGVQLETREDAIRLLADTDLLQRGVERGVTRGLVIAAFEVLGQGAVARGILRSPVADSIAQTGVQGATGFTGEVAAQVAAGQDINLQEALIEGLAETATAPAEIGIAAVGAERNRRAEAVEGYREAQTVERLNELVTNTRLRDRSPKAFRRLMQANGYDRRSIYIDAEALVDAVADDDTAINTLGVTADQLQRAADSGTAVAVNLQTYIENVPGKNQTLERLFVQNGRLHADTASRAQAETYLSEEMPARRAEAAEQRAVQSSRQVMRTQITKAVREQLVAAGQSPTVARSSAELHGAFFETMAERFGNDQVASMFGIEVVGPGTPNQRDDGRTLAQSEAMPGMEEISELVAQGAAPEQLMALPQVTEAIQRMESIPPTIEKLDFSDADTYARRVYRLSDGAEISGVEALFNEMENISAAYAGGEVRQEKRVDILLGPPAAGKSTIAEMIAPEAGARIVDSDDIKKLIPEFEGGVGANAVHEESSILGKVFLDRVLARGDNLVLPKVGDNPSSISGLMAKLKQAGYEVNLVNMEVAEGEPFRRMMGRFASTGRLVNPQYVVAVGNKPQSTYDQLKGEADGYASYDNNVPFGTKPPVTEDTRRGADGEAARGGQDDAAGQGEPAAAEAAGGRTEAAEERVLAQGDRGRITIPTEGVMSGASVIELFKNSDESTFLHESGHFFLEVFQTLAVMDSAPDTMKADMAAINQFLGRAEDDTSTFTTAQQEQWAEAFEVYLMEGKAPSSQLKSAFSKFASWLTRIYERALNIGAQPTPEIKRIMDRLLATDEEIAVSRAETDSQALFAEIPPGMTEQEYQPYLRLVQREEAETQGRVLNRAMNRVRRRRTAEMKERRKQIEQEVRDALREQQVYKLIEGLGNKGFGESARLNKNQLVDMFGEQVLQDLSRSRHSTQTNLYIEDGTDIEIVADTMGYDSVGQMIVDLRGALPLNEAVQVETDRRIENELGDPLDETSIREEAEAALKNGYATERVAREAAALARAATGSTGPSRWQQQNAAAKQEAEDRINRMSVREVMGYRQFLRASQTASRAAQRELAKVVRRADGTTGQRSRDALQAAADAKRRQLLNDHLYRIAREKARRFEAARKRFQRLQKRSSRKNIGAEFMDVIDSLLDQYSFRQVPIREVKRRGDVRELYKKVIEENRGAELAIPLSVLSEVQQRHYTELTTIELEGVVDAVDNVAHMGRATQKQIAADEAFDTLTALENIEERADKNLTDRPLERERGERGGFRDLGRQFALHVLNTDSILRDIDGDETPLGPAYNAIKRPIDKGVAQADARRQQAARDIADIYTEHLGSHREIGRLRKDKKVYNGIRHDGQPEALTRLGLISMALNAGNRDNWERLTNEGGKHTYKADAVQSLLVRELKENEWRFVQSVWDYLDSYWPEIRDQERKYTGVTPKKVETRLMIDGAPDFVTGGYYPIRYDTELSSSSDDLERAKLATEGTVGVFGKAQTSHGHTNERQKSTGRPVDLSLGIIDNHVFNVIHDLELRGPVRDAARVVYSERFGDMMGRKQRGEDVRALKAWLQDVAAGDKVLAYGMERWFRWMRGGFTLSAIGFKVSTIMIQPLGLTQSVVQVGYGAMARGFAQYVRQGPAAMHRLATSKSAVMQERIRTFDRDISQITGELAAGQKTQRGYQRFVNTYLPFAYAGMQHMQYWAVDLPTWLSSYEKALRNGSKEADAVTIADRDVRVAQGSGLMSDRGMLERGRISPTGTPHEMARLFTVLGSYMFSKFNLAYRRARGTDFKDPVALAKLTMDFSMLFVVEAFLVYLLRNGWPDEEDDEPPIPLIMAREGAYTAMGTMPVFREVAGGLQGFGGGSAYAEYTGAASALFEAGGGLARGLAEGNLEDATDRRVVEGLLGFGGTAFFLPSGQINKTLDAIFTRDWEIEDDAVANFLESITGLPVGGEDES